MNLGPENEKVEHKKSTSELKEGVASIASILNKHGEGTLYFGVANNGDVVGQQVADSTLRQISQTISTSIEPRVFPEVIALDDGEGHEYVKVAFSGDNRPYACKGTYRIRVADEDVLMTGDEVRRMAKEAFLKEHPWDTLPSDRPISDVNEETLKAFVERGLKARRIKDPYTGVQPTLSSLGLLVDGALTNAADVLFCGSRNVRLKMGILESHSRTKILDLHQESGDLFELVDKAETYILNNTRREFVIDDIGPRKEIPELPVAAVREGLINAFVHRDWTSSASVQIDIFYDSVEIYSPGWFIEGQSPEAHLYDGDTSSKTRNELIASTVFRSGDMESYGTGISRIKDLCDEAGVEIEYIRVPSGTKLVFHRNDAFAANSELPMRESARKCAKVRERFASQLTEAEMILAEHVEEKGSITTTDAMEVVGLQRRGTQKMLNRLIEAGALKRVGGSRNTHYVINSEELSE